MVEPVTTSHSLISPPFEPAASVSPSGEKSSDLTQLLRPVSLSILVAVFRVPEVDISFEVPGSEGCPIG